MANAIAVQVYRLERNPVTGNDYVSLSYAGAIKQELVEALFPVNTTHGTSTPGLPFLYCKVVQRQPALEQEFYVMNSVQDIQNKLNS